MNTLSINYKLIINQLNTSINQLLHDKEEVERIYNENIKKNALIKELVKRLKNNYRLTQKTNLINKINYLNFTPMKHIK